VEGGLSQDLQETGRALFDGDVCLEATVEEGIHLMHSRTRALVSRPVVTCGCYATGVGKSTQGAGEKGFVWSGSEGIVCLEPPWEGALPRVKVQNPGMKTVLPIRSRPDEPMNRCSDL